MVAVTYGSAHGAAANARPAGKGFFARLMSAMMEARLRQAYREIELYQDLARDWQRNLALREHAELQSGR
jgi:hypothetical protein